MRKLCTRLVLSLLSAFVASCATKSENPLAPTVAGPLPGVGISAPTLVSPNGTRISVEAQPVTLVVGNSNSNGPRPFTYSFEVATDAGFSNKVFTRAGITPGGSQTALRLPDPLATQHTYYWRAKADDGANQSDYSGTAQFEVYTPIVIDQPQLMSPANNTTVSTTRPTFTFSNAPRSGPAGPITYTIQVSGTDSFALNVAWTVAEQPNQTTAAAPQDGPYSTGLFWRVRASDPTTAGPWSAVSYFVTPAAPPPPPTTPPPSAGGGGGGGASFHVGPGPLTEDRARQVVYATSNEFPQLTRVFGSDGEALSAAEELLLRTVWHLQLAGYQSARQRNPSGVISDDKLNILLNGSWQAYDIFSLGFAGRATTVQFVSIGGANPIPDSGIPD
jgi:hypothetical protein